MTSKDNFLETASIRNDQFSPGFEAWLSRAVDFINNLNSNVETVTSATPGVTYSGTTVVTVTDDSGGTTPSTGIELSDVFNALVAGQRISLAKSGNKLTISVNNTGIKVDYDIGASALYDAIDMDATSGHKRVYFYTASAHTNDLTVKKADSTSNWVYLEALENETIEDEKIQIIKTPKTSLHFVSDGTSNWVLR